MVNPSTQIFKKMFLVHTPTNHLSIHVDIEMLKLQLKAHLKVFCSSKHPLSIPKCDTWKANIAHFLQSDIMWYGIDFIMINFSVSLSLPIFR
jgi:hypothetical protein